MLVPRYAERLAHGRRLRKRVLHWGDAFGIRLTRTELDRLGLRENSEVDVVLEAGVPEIDWRRLELFSLGGDASLRHDQIIRDGATGSEAP